MYYTLQYVVSLCRYIIKSNRNRGKCKKLLNNSCKGLESYKEKYKLIIKKDFYSK